MKRFFKLLLISCSIVFMSFIFFTIHNIIRLNNIGRDLLQVSNITDFSSNRNHPVKGVENIGPEIYSIVSEIKNKKVIVKVRLGSPHVDNYVTNLFYYTIYYYWDDNQFSFHLYYEPSIGMFRIKGY